MIASATMGTDLVENGAPIFAWMGCCVTRPSIDLRGPGALHVVVGLFETGQQFRGENGTLVRFELKRL